MNSKFLKIICSIPVVLIFLLFFPFVGICLTILRFFVYRNKNVSVFAKDMIVLSVTILIPKLATMISEMFEYEILYLNNIVNSSIYLKLMSSSKFILCLGIIILIVYYIYIKISVYIKIAPLAYINDVEKTNREVSEKNDMKIKEKQETAKNTKVVYCPFCGGDNIIVGKTGKCKYCRKSIS